MQSLWIKTQSSPLEAPYFSCVPYLLGEGQAMQYSIWPKSRQKTRIPRLPFRPPDDYLREAMIASLAKGDVELDVRLQLQTDPHLTEQEFDYLMMGALYAFRPAGLHLRDVQATFSGIRPVVISCVRIHQCPKFGNDTIAWRPIRSRFSRTGFGRRVA